jgi:hypothetical protein
MSGLIGLAGSRTGAVGKARGKDLANMWIRFAGTGTIDQALVVSQSYNVSSVTDNGTGKYFINFIKNMSNATYFFTGFLAYPGGSFNDVAVLAQDGTYANTTSQLKISTMTSLNDGTQWILDDCAIITVIVFGG